MSSRIIPIIYVISLLCPGTAGRCEEARRAPDPETVLSTLRPGHPRLILNDVGLEKLRRTLRTDTTAARYYDDVLKQADAICREPTLSYEARENHRLLSVSRRCMERMYALGLAWRLTGGDRYARKAEEDLLAVCALENWTPSLVIIYPLQEKHKRFEEKHGWPPWSFLDVAEMCHAVGIGYDWFYHGLSPEARETVKSALIEKGLELGVMAYTGKGAASGGKDAWTTYNHNWNMVCNGGLIVGALAVAETDPDYAEIIIPNAVRSLPIALTTYGPDGAWPEGPSYWGYATRYTVFGLSALESALGTDYGLSNIDGLSETGFFPLLTTGPTGYYLNFADSGENNARGSIPCLFWLARRYGNAFFSDSEHEMAAKHGADPLHLAWYSAPSNGVAPELELDTYFRGPTEVAVFRSGLNDSDALFVGVKAGDNTFNHAHLDLGSFELDALGVRWARDLGSDSYSLPGYFDFYYLTGESGGRRWSYYRNASESHNVPLLNGRGQDELAKATFTTFASNRSSAHVIVDLSEAYAYAAVKTERGIALVDNRRAVLVQDECMFEGDTDVAWGMTTDAEITVDGAAAVLRRDGKELIARILAPPGASFTVESAEQAPPQKRNEGVKRLMVRIKGKKGAFRMAVLLSPRWEDGREVDSAKVVPLSAWK